jgi:hypothetical protein
MKFGLGLVLSVGLAVAATGTQTQLVITARPDGNSGTPPILAAGDVAVVQGKTPAKVVGLQRLAGELADMQLFVFLDDSSRSSGLGVQLPDLKKFIASLPATTQVAVGYMRNGSFALAQAFTTDHQKAANSLRLPAAMPGENGSPYFALSDLVDHWPSKESTGRRAVLMLTDGVDRYYTQADMSDPYVEAAIHDALKHGVMVSSIYLRGAGFYGGSGWVTNFAQSRLNEVSDETGGHAYFMGLSDPVSLRPFLKDFEQRLENQYRATVEITAEKGVQPVKLRTESPTVKVEGPTRIYVQ